MEITLRNGEKIRLEWSSVILEYLEEYEGGIEQLRKDIDDTSIRFRTFNFILYCAVSSSYHKELGYREAIKLVDINDLDRIIEFIVQNVNSLKTVNVQKEEKEEYTNIATNRSHRM